MKQILITSLTLFLLMGCTSTPETDNKQPSEYQAAMKLVHSGQYDAALETLQKIYERDESSTQRAQAEMGMIFANYKKGDFEQVDMISANVLKTYPTHPELAYVLFLRGMSLQIQGEKEITKLFEQHIPSGKYPEKLRDAYGEFVKLIKRYPDTIYATEAHKRLPSIRDNLAYYELHVAKYYLVQGDNEEVIKRARYVKEYYESFLVRKKALNLMKKAYTAMDDKSRLKIINEALLQLEADRLR